MSTPRDWHIVSYDVRDPKRLKRVFKLMKGYGERVQYSVFRVRASSLQLERMRWELEEILQPEDDLLVVHLCNGCAQRVKVRNQDKAWPPDDPSFKVIG